MIDVVGGRFRSTGWEMVLARSVALCFVLAVMVWGCSVDETDQFRDAGGGDTALKDADSSRDAEDAGDDTTDSRPDSSNDETINGGNDDNDDSGWTTPDWFECECEHPEDQCAPASRCGRPGIECGPGGEECPDGYTCETAGPSLVYCRCDGSREDCGPYCETHDDCISACDRHDGVCRPQGGRCTRHIRCPDGEICVESPDDDSFRKYCFEAGDGQEGEWCEHDIECESGHCVSWECLVVDCWSDGDCPDGEHCIQRECTDTEGGTMECEVSCPDDTRCIRDECHGAFCEKSGDCDGADCVWQGTTFPAECEEHPDADEGYVCKPEEYRGSSGESCILPGSCWSDEDCGGEPYECTSNICRRDIDAGDSS